MAKRLGILVAFLLLVPAVSFADPINIGIIFFDILSPGEGLPDVYTFNITNQTGDPLLPFFPVVTPLAFLNSKLTLNMVDGSSQTFQLGRIDPGGLDPPSELRFGPTDLFSSARFEATLSTDIFDITDGTPDGITLFKAASLFFSADLFPFEGSTLKPLDLALLTVSEEAATTVPEPSTVLLLGTGLLALIAVKMRSRTTRPPCTSGF